MRNKVMIILSILFTSGFASAESSGIGVLYWDCSDPKKYTFMSGGEEDDGEVVFTREYWSDEGPRTEIDKFTGYEIEVKNLRKVKIKQVKTEGGFEKLFYLKAQLSKHDGTKFPQETVGVTKDRKSVVADFICKEVY